MPDYSGGVPSRLSEISENLSVAPFRHASNLTHCELYWLPESLPATEAQREWTLKFLAGLVKRFDEHKLLPELFVEIEALYPDRHDDFIQTALDFNPVMGFSRAPGAPLPSVPKNDDIAAIRRQEKPFDLKPFLRGICYWFARKNLLKQMDLFWGFGGMTMLLVKPDQGNKVPRIEIPGGIRKHPGFKAALEQVDVEGMMETAAAVQSGFLKKSKEHFGRGWEQRMEYRGLLYVLPRWSSHDFFQLPEDEVKHLFEVCDLFVTESPVDKGILLASATPVRRLIHELVEEMQETGMIFPELP